MCVCVCVCVCVNVLCIDSRVGMVPAVAEMRISAAPYCSLGMRIITVLSLWSQIEGLTGLRMRPPLHCTNNAPQCGVVTLIYSETVAQHFYSHFEAELCSNS